MKARALIVAVLALAIIPAGLSAARNAQVRLVSSSPLVVRGTGFQPGERIVVSVVSGALRRSAVARSSAAGAFVANFARPLPALRCGASTVTAVGNRGDKASWESGARMCGGPLRP